MLFAAADYPSFFADFGETATLKRSGATTSSTVSAVFDEGKGLGKGLGRSEGENLDGAFLHGLANHALIFLRQDQVPLKPAYLDRVTRASGEIFTIQQSKDEDGLWKCWASNDERGSF